MSGAGGAGGIGGSAGVAGAGGQPGTGGSGGSSGPGGASGAGGNGGQSPDASMMHQDGGADAMNLLDGSIQPSSGGTSSGGCYQVHDESTQLGLWFCFALICVSRLRRRA